MRSPTLSGCVRAHQLALPCYRAPLVEAAALQVAAGGLAPWWGAALVYGLTAESQQLACSQPASMFCFCLPKPCRTCPRLSWWSSPPTASARLLRPWQRVRKHRLLVLVLLPAWTPQLLPPPPSLLQAIRGWPAPARARTHLRLLTWLALPPAPTPQAAAPRLWAKAPRPRARWACLAWTQARRPPTPRPGGRPSAWLTPAVSWRTGWRTA